MTEWPVQWQALKSAWTQTCLNLDWTVPWSLLLCHQRQSFCHRMNSCSEEIHEARSLQTVEVIPKSEKSPSIIRKLQFIHKGSQPTALRYCLNLVWTPEQKENERNSQNLYFRDDSSSNFYPNPRFSSAIYGKEDPVPLFLLINEWTGCVLI